MSVPVRSVDSLRGVPMGQWTVLYMVVVVVVVTPGLRRNTD